MVVGPWVQPCAIYVCHSLAFPLTGPVLHPGASRGARGAGKDRQRVRELGAGQAGGGAGQVGGGVGPLPSTSLASLSDPSGDMRGKQRGNSVL